ncbi:hypothetical protein EVAR_91470_1 [Eumeta japonica]|uniref:Uncharacterized protein n=1 Tax=Eumeta variegata TaxID=151549 RepID=A0A4C1WZA7_EUMVA|nr:hypothetical protein EVAR_91470_1 [Eumeta japonica]
MGDLQERAEQRLPGQLVGARPGPQNVRLARARRPAAPDVLRSFQKSRYRLVSCGRRSRRVEKCVTFLR